MDQDLKKMEGMVDASKMAGHRLCSFRSNQPLNIAADSVIVEFQQGGMKENVRSFCHDVAEVNRISELYRISSLHTIRNVLKIKKFMRNVDSDGMPVPTITVLYPYFDPWPTPPPMFQENEGPLDNFWKVVLKDILVAFSDMHGNYLYHGNARSRSSYVMMNNNVKLINVGVDGSKFSENERNVRRQHDLDGLLWFVEQYRAHQSTEWSDFMNLIARGAEAKQLKKCQVLLDDEGQYRYYRQIFRDYKSKWNQATKESFRDALDKETNPFFYNWKPIIDSGSTTFDDIIREVFYHQGGHAHANPSDLFDFIEKYFDHYGQLNRKATKPEVVSGGKVLRKLMDKFPAEAKLLSRVHFILVTQFPHEDITSRKLI